jgi:hypothetical protein
VNLDKDGYIIADETCQTCKPGILGGDCRTKKSVIDDACAVVRSLRLRLCAISIPKSFLQKAKWLSRSVCKEMLDHGLTPFLTDDFNSL